MLTPSPNRPPINYPDDPDAPRPGPGPVPISDITPGSTNWLWPGYLALHQLHLLLGDPGSGKSFLAMDLAARLSTGAPWPGQPAHTPARAPANALLLGEEDNHETTLLPRLIKAGADTTKIFLPNSNYFHGSCVLPRDFEALCFHILRIDAKLVVLDPLLAFLDPSALATPARAYSFAEKLQFLARAGECVIIAVMHLTKTRFRSAIHRAPGGAALAAVSRSIFMAIPDPREETPDPAQHLLVSIKNNLAPRPPAIAYRLADNQLHWQPNPIMCPQPDQLLAAVPPPATHDQSKLEACAAWLLQQLSTGPQARLSLLGRAASAGYAERTLTRAKALLRLKTDISPDHGAIWSLPPTHTPTSPAAAATPTVVKALAALAVLAMIAFSIKKPSKIADFTTRPSRPNSAALAALASSPSAPCSPFTLRSVPHSPFPARLLYYPSALPIRMMPLSDED